MTADELRGRRQALGLSLEALGRRLDIPKDTLSRWELGKQPIRHDAMLSRALTDLEREMRTYSVVERPIHVYQLHQGDPGGPVLAEMLAGQGNLATHDAVKQLLDVAVKRGARYIRHCYGGFDWVDDLAKRAG